MSGLGGNPQSSSEPDPIRLLTISIRYGSKPHSIINCHCCAFNLGKNSKMPANWEANSHCVLFWKKSAKRPLQIRIQIRIRRTGVCEIDARLRIRRWPCAAQRGDHRCWQTPVNLKLIASIEGQPLALA